jgi:hypothetical protein
METRHSVWNVILVSGEAVLMAISVMLALTIFINTLKRHPPTFVTDNATISTQPDWGTIVELAP